MPPDAPAATDTPSATGGAFGLNAEEQAAFDEMRSQPAPTGDPGHSDPAPEPAPAAAETTAKPAQVEPAAGSSAPPAAADGADDDDDEVEPAPLADGTKPPKRVSYNKYRRLEESLKAEKAEKEAEREKGVKAAENQARLDERLRLINEALQPPAGAAQQQDEDPEPDPETDIFGHNAWLKRQLVKTNETIAQIQTGRQAETTEQQLASSYMDDAQRFSQSEPNFGPAYNYLMQVRMAQLANYHFGKDLTDPATPPLTVQEIAKIRSEVAREEKALVGNALKAGKSPAAAVYAMARMTGYRPQAPAAATGAAPANGGAQPATINGAAPAPTAAANGTVPAVNGASKPTVKAQIDAIKNGQEASLSLSHGGGAPAPALNAEKLANMPEEEFGALLENMTRAQLKQIMGGA